MGWYRLLVVLVVVWGASVTGAQDVEDLSGEETIIISQHQRSKVKVVLESFRAGPGASSREASMVQQVVSQDLDYSGIFKVLTVDSYTDETQSSGYEAIVRATVEFAGTSLVLRGTLEALPSQEIILRRDYTGAAKDYRELAHRYADDIVLFLTGETGIARTRLAFVMQTQNTKEIYVVDYDGHGLHQVTDNGTINMSPRWGPEGTELAYVTYVGGDADIYRVDLETGLHVPWITGQGVQSAPAWSPSGGGLLAFSETRSGHSYIELADISGKNRRRITQGAGIDTSPAWSPDGLRLVFTSDRSGNPHLYITHLEGGGSRRLTFAGKWNDLPAWSPDGKRIAFVSRRRGLFRIYSTDPSGMSAHTQLTFGPGSDETPRWAPDGRHLVFSSSREGERGIYVLNTESGVIRPVVVGKGDCYLPDWSPVAKRKEER